ncbi:MAG: riboflavin synthase [Bryobacteraceae bacterium]|nr:riboflavin synthase [Bryobacteraceae bacterium]
MFTGIVEEVGAILAFQSNSAGGARIRVGCSGVLADAVEGSSIAVSGVCLTAVAIDDCSFSADLAPETLRRTSFGRLTAGAFVNLERPLLPTGRLSGHVVQGHVDGTGELLALEDLGENNWWLKIAIPRELDRYVVFKGSVCLDGISLTVASIENQVLSVTIIPHTWEATALKSHQPGDLVNIETDVFARYAEKMLAAR